MGRSIVEQPDGKYAVYNSISDQIEMWDATREEIIKFMGERARERAEWETEQTFTHPHLLKLSPKWGECLRDMKRNLPEEYAELLKVCPAAREATKPKTKK